MIEFTQTPTGSPFHPVADPSVSADSPQYGPAWVADHYGTTHYERLTEVLRNTKTRAGRASWRTAPRDEVAKAYALFTEEVRVDLVTRSASDEERA